MKVHNALFALFLAVTAASADDVEVGCDGEATPEKVCLEDGDYCTDDVESCCDGLTCNGYGFFKKCGDPPVCLPKWHDCSNGVECCDDLVCAIGKQGQQE